MASPLWVSVLRLHAPRGSWRLLLYPSCCTSVGSLLLLPPYLRVLGVVGVQMMPFHTEVRHGLPT